MPFSLIFAIRCVFLTSISNQVTLIFEVGVHHTCSVTRITSDCFRYTLPIMTYIVPFGFVSVYFIRHTCFVTNRDENNMSFYCSNTY